MNAPRRHALANAVSLCLLVSAPFAAPGLAAAQDAQPGATTLDTVQVTGTRIKKAEIEGQVPVQTLNREDIERTGLTSVGDILQELTGAGSAFASGNVVRFVPKNRNPATAEPVTVEYAVYPIGAKDKATTGRVSITVMPLPTQATPNQPPVARSFSTRAR